MRRRVKEWKRPVRAMRGEIQRKGKSGVMLGHLVELVVVTPSGDRKMSESRLRGQFLSWIPSNRNFAIVRKTTKRAPASITARDRDIFSKFHKGKTRKVVIYEAPDRRGTLSKLGRLRSLTYVTPRDIPSPQKRNYRWVHAFGDHGESGHGEHTETKTYPASLMPILAKDSAGNLFILRQPGNKYDVTEWIYW